MEEGVKFYKVNGKKGTIVRKAAAMDSDKVQIVESGTVVSVVATTELENGKVRYEIDEPVQGWGHLPPKWTACSTRSCSGRPPAVRRAPAPRV